MSIEGIVYLSRGCCEEGIKLSATFPAQELGPADLFCSGCGDVLECTCRPCSVYVLICSGIELTGVVCYTFGYATRIERLHVPRSMRGVLGGLEGCN